MKNRNGDAGKALAARLHERVQGWHFIEREAVVLRGSNGATVHGCRKILQYSPIEIQLLLSEAVISLEGERLYCTSFGAGSVTVEGSIQKATYLPKETT